MCKLMRFFMLGKRKGRVISCAKGGVNSGGGGCKHTGGCLRRFLKWYHKRGGCGWIYVLSRVQKQE